MGKCCYDLAKFLVFIVNFAAWLGAGLLLGGCILALVKSNEILGIEISPDLNPENPTAIYFSLILIVLVIFGFLIIFTFLGCCGAACTNRCMLGSFIIILFVFLGGNIGGIVYMYLHFKSEVEMVTVELAKTIRYYDVEDEISLVKKFWDFWQSNLKCCGASGWSDWSTCEGLKPGRKVPASCCLPDEDCVYEPSYENTYGTGCVPQIDLYIQIVFWGIPSLMLLILILSLVVCSRAGDRRHDGYESRKRYGNGDAVSQYSEETGYVYRNGGGGGANTSAYSNPPYNPHYPAADNYPTGVASPPDFRQPLMSANYGPPTHQPQPPPYRDVIAPSYQGR